MSIGLFKVYSLFLEISLDNKPYLVPSDVPVLIYLTFENLNQGVTTRGRLFFHDNLAFISYIELKFIAEALQDESWILTMQDELN